MRNRPDLFLCGGLLLQGDIVALGFCHRSVGCWFYCVGTDVGDALCILYTYIFVFAAAILEVTDIGTSLNKIIRTFDEHRLKIILELTFLNFLVNIKMGEIAKPTLIFLQQCPINSRQSGGTGDCSDGSGDGVGVGGGVGHGEEGCWVI